MTHDKQHQSTALLYWLYTVAFMIFTMAVIGAITRLTESGLSIVEWKPLTGALPPLSHAEWEHVFDLYQQSPEYQKINKGMELTKFKQIFFWEWFHRLWGRMIGIVYVLPLAYFWIRRQIPEGYKAKLLIGLVLGGLQGVVGWYMVKSGLVDRPSVSHFRLTIHLMLACAIYAYVLWIAFSLRNQLSLSFWCRPESSSLKEQDPDLRRDDKYSFCLKRHGWIALAFALTAITWGAFVAGLDAGMVYNTWPMMGSHWVPPELTGFITIFHDPVAVQFVHRWIAIVTAIIVLSFAYRIKSFALAGMVLLQVGLGIVTLLSQVMIPLAALHQAGAFILVGLLIFHLQRVMHNRLNR